jgi:hypothetical protein
MELERRGWVTAVALGQPVRRDEPLVQRKAAAFARWHEPYKSRGFYVRIRERLGVKFPKAPMWLAQSGR